MINILVITIIIRTIVIVLMLRIAIITTIISLSLITRVTRIFLDNVVDFKREILLNSLPNNEVFLQISHKHVF